MVDGTIEEPSFKSDDWQMIEGRFDVRMEFDSTGGFSFFPGGVDTILTPIVLIGNINVSDDIEIDSWSWKRESGDAVADAIWDAQHQSTRALELKNEGMGPRWSKANRIKFICSAIYPNSRINEVVNYIEL